MPLNLMSTNNVFKQLIPIDLHINNLFKLHENYVNKVIKVLINECFLISISTFTKNAINFQINENKEQVL